MYPSGGNDENTHINVTTATIGSRRELQLQGPRPPPLKVLLRDSLCSTANKVISKKPTTVISSINHDSRHQFIGRRRKPGRTHLGNQPIVIHVRSPKIIHTRPQDFMVLVQQLTGNHEQSNGTHDQEEEDDHRNSSDESNKDFDSDKGITINNRDINEDEDHHDQFLELQLNSSAYSDHGVSISSLKSSNIFSPAVVFANTRFISSSPILSSNWQDFGGSIF